MWYEGIVDGLPYLVIGIMVFFLAKLILRFFLPFDVDAELTVRDNIAVGYAVAGYLAAVLIVFLGGAVGQEHSILGDVIRGQTSISSGVGAMGKMVGFAFGGVVLLNFGRIVMDKAVMHGFCMIDEVSVGQNKGAGVVEGGTYVSTGLVVAGALQQGSMVGGSMTSLLVCFLIGQAVLILYGLFYEWITHYDFKAEIERGNVAAGKAFGFHVIAMGVVLLKGINIASGEGLWMTLGGIFGFAGIGFVMLFLAHRAADAFLLSQSCLTHEIETDENVNGALLEGVCVVGVSVLIFFLL